MAKKDEAETPENVDNLFPDQDAIEQGVEGTDVFGLPDGDAIAPDPDAAVESVQDNLHGVAYEDVSKASGGTKTAKKAEKASETPSEGSKTPSEG